MCGRYDISHSMFSPSHTIWLCSSLPRTPVFLHRLPKLSPYRWASGRYDLSFANGSELVTTKIVKKRVVVQDCSKNLCFELQQTLTGSTLHLIREKGYACEHSWLNVTVELLLHRNASVSVPRMVYGCLETIITSLDIRPDMPPIMDVVRDLGSIDFRSKCSYLVGFLVTVFILPFSWEIWQ